MIVARGSGSLSYAVAAGGARAAALAVREGDQLKRALEGKT